MSASGRVCEITNGRFVEAKHEKRWLAVRLLRSKPAGRFGSASAGRVRELTAGKMTPKLCDRKADVRGRQYTTLCGHPHRCIERSEAAFERAN